MAKRIFVNYRREISIATAGRLFDELERTFGRGRVFMDVDEIPPGKDFVVYLDQQVAKCDLFLVVIESNWLGVTDNLGRRRLDNPEDFVRIEVASALRREIPVVPVLVDDAKMPAADDLPEDLRALARRQAVSIRHAQFGTDIARLVRRLDGPAGTQHLYKRASWLIVLLLLASALLWAGLMMRPNWTDVSQQNSKPGQPENVGAKGPQSARPPEPGGTAGVAEPTKPQIIQSARSIVTGVAAFDGLWILEQTWSGCRLGTQVVTVEIAGGIIRAPGGRPRNLTGRVDERGMTNLQYDIRDETGTEWTNFYGGALLGDVITGQAYSKYCSGTFALRRTK